MKRNICKWICALLAAAMMFPAGQVTPAADTIESTDYDRAFSLLSYLEIFDSSLTLDEVEPDSLVTRGDFSVYLARLLNTNTTGTATLYYTDVSKSHYAFEEITLLTELGYLVGTGAKRFEPDKPILSQDAGTLLVKALGLVSFINSGAADTSFIYRAMREAGISYRAGGNVTFRDMTLMLYNALQAEYYQLASTGRESTYFKIDGETLLYKTREMRFSEKGLLSAANGADIYGAAYDSDSAVIDGVRYSVDSKSYINLLGRFVDYVYTDDDSPVLKWAVDSGDSRALEIVIGDEGGYDAQSGQFWYFKNSREKRANIAPSAVMAYNGRPLGSDAAAVLAKPNTRVTLLSSYGNSSYDIVLIESYWNLMVAGKSSSDNIIYDRNSDKSVSLNPERYDALYIEDADGAEYEWTEIQTDSILSVFESQDGNYVRVVVSDVTASGMIGQMKGDGDIVIGDGVYRGYSDDVFSGLQLGASVTCYLDFQGYVAAVKTGTLSANQFVGFALAGVCQSKTFDTELTLKILSETGSIEDYKTEKRLNINDYVYKDMEKAFEQLSENGMFKPQIMLCQVNSSGKLTRIDTAFADDGGVHPLTINREIKKDLDKVEHGMYVNGRIGVNMLTNSKTKVFSVPENLGSDFSRCFVSSLRMWDDYRGAVSYRTTAEDTFYEQYVVTRQITYGDTASNHAIQMIDEIYTSLDADGELVQHIVYTSGNGSLENAVAQYLDLDAYNLKRGDAVRLATTASNKNQVEYVSIVSRAEDDAAVGASLRETPYATRTISAYAYDKLGFAVKIGWDSGAKFDEIIQVSAGMPVAVYDSERDEVYMGSVEDIKTYKSDGTPSRLLLQSYQGTLQRVFVYR